MNTRQEFEEEFEKILPKERNDHYIIDYFVGIIRVLQYSQNPYFPDHKPLNLKQHYFAKALDSLSQIKDPFLRKTLKGFIQNELSDRVH